MLVKNWQVKLYRPTDLHLILDDLCKIIEDPKTVEFFQDMITKFFGRAYADFLYSKDVMASRIKRCGAYSLSEVLGGYKLWITCNTSFTVHIELEEMP